MRMPVRILFPLASIVLVGPAPLSAVAQIDTTGWTFAAQDHRLEEHGGRTALMLERGVAWLPGTAFRDGVIEVDVALPDALSFAGVIFHDDGDGNHEHVYLRAHLSGKPDACQYDAVFHGVAGWQIYAGPRFNAPFLLDHHRWMHLRIVVSGTRASVQVDDQPVFVVPELLHGPRAGRIGLQATGAPAHFADLRVTAGSPPPIDGTGAPAEPVAATVVREWRVSEPFPEAALEGPISLQEAAVEPGSWRRLRTGERGIANLARTTGIAQGRNTVLAAVTLTSDTARTVAADFGFSDRVRVYLNGRLLFVADDGWRTRDYRFLGTVGLHDRLLLPLREGGNELVFAVSESFGGWAVLLDLPDREGLVIHP